MRLVSVRPVRLDSKEPLADAGAIASTLQLVSVELRRLRLPLLDEASVSIDALSVAPRPALPVRVEIMEPARCVRFEMVGWVSAVLVLKRDVMAEFLDD